MSGYFGDYRIFDAHVHPEGGAGLALFLESAREFMDETGIMGVNLLCIKGRYPRLAGVDLLALSLKANDPRFSVYGGFEYWRKTVDHDGPGLLAQLETMQAIGFDGLKMLEGKPTERAASGIPLDDPRYDPAFDLLEKTGFHILYHVNDPEEFWDKETCPAWANDGAGGYWDSKKFLSKEQHYREIENLLARHPGIKITFAHAYFLSNFPDRMTALLDKYPNVTVDICPGIEMYDGFTKQYKKWREIFTAYEDRFLFGTDNVIKSTASAAVTHDGGSRYKIENITRFLTGSGEFEAWGFRLRGMGLPAEISRKILCDNYLGLRGPVKPINKDAVISYAESLNAEINDRDDTGECPKRDIADTLAFFRAL